MPSSEECQDALINPVRDIERELCVVTRERDDLKRRLRDMHQWHCTSDNCMLDGGEEHEEYFDAGGMNFREKVAEEFREKLKLEGLTVS